MNIAIPVEAQSMETTVDQSLGSKPYFLVFEIASKESIFLVNNATTCQDCSI